MIFISKAMNHAVTVRNPIYSYTKQGKHIEANAIVVQFEGGRLTHEQKLFGDQHFQKTSARPYGAAPAATATMFTDESSSAAGIVARGLDRKQGFGSFDTEVDCSPENRELIEQSLLKADRHGYDFVLFVKAAVKAPWPTYEQMHWKEIGPEAEKLGFLQEAYEFEEARDTPRQGVLDDLKERIEKQAADAAETSALERTF